MGEFTLWETILEWLLRLWLCKIKREHSYYYEDLDGKIKLSTYCFRCYKDREQ